MICFGKHFLALAALLAAMLPARAQDRAQVSGEWLVGTQAAPAGGEPVTAAVRKVGRWMFSIKCIGKEMQFVLVSLDSRVPFTEGDFLSAQFRIDDQETRLGRAYAVTNQMLVLVPDNAMLLQTERGREAALHFISTIGEFDVVVPLTGAADAIIPVLKACM